MINIAFFNNKGGVGKTSLVYHLAWMFAERGIKTLAVDLDPQSNLTAMFLTPERLEQLWLDDPAQRASILRSVRPIVRGVGDVIAPHVEQVDSRVGLVVGDLALSSFEDRLSDAWPRSMDRQEDAFRTLSAFHRLIQMAGAETGATIALIDVGPNLGAINRAALIAADWVVTPLAPDMFSIQGLRNLGPTLADWRLGWTERLQRRPPDPELSLPAGTMCPAGYVVMQTGMRLDRPVKAYYRRPTTDGCRGSQRSTAGPCWDNNRTQRSRGSRKTQRAWVLCATTAASCRWRKTHASRCSNCAPPTGPSERIWKPCSGVTVIFCH